MAQLVREIENADVPQLWWDSELLARASRVRDVRAVRALALCHHSLSNKEAFSAHTVRNAIKIIDAPDFPLCWSIIDAEKDAGQIIQRLEDFSYTPWAVRSYRKFLELALPQHAAQIAHARERIREIGNR